MTRPRSRNITVGTDASAQAGIGSECLLKNLFVMRAEHKYFIFGGARVERAPARRRRDTIMLPIYWPSENNNFFEKASDDVLQSIGIRRASMVFYSPLVVGIVDSPALTGDEHAIATAEPANARAFDY